jgi:hypothetical protein
MTDTILSQADRDALLRCMEIAPRDPENSTCPTLMSALGQKRTHAVQQRMSALGQ